MVMATSRWILATWASMHSFGSISPRLQATSERAVRNNWSKGGLLRNKQAGRRVRVTLGVTAVDHAPLADVAVLVVSVPDEAGRGDIKGSGAVAGLLAVSIGGLVGSDMGVARRNGSRLDRRAGSSRRRGCDGDGSEDGKTARRNRGIDGLARTGSPNDGAANSGRGRVRNWAGPDEVHRGGGRGHPVLGNKRMSISAEREGAISICAGYQKNGPMSGVAEVFLPSRDLPDLRQEASRVGGEMGKNLRLALRDGSFNLLRSEKGCCERNITMH